MDSDDAVGKNEGRNSRQDDAGYVNYVLSQSEFQTADIRNDLNNAVRGIGNEPHIERHGGSDSYTENGKNQQGNSKEQRAGRGWNDSGKEIHDPGKHQT